MSGAIIEVHAHPRSSSPRVAIREDGGVDVYVKSPASEGQANDELIKVLAKAMGVSRSQLSLAAGRTHKRKLIRVEGWSKEDVSRAMHGIR